MLLGLGQRKASRRRAADRAEARRAKAGRRTKVGAVLVGGTAGKPACPTRVRRSPP